VERGTFLRAAEALGAALGEREVEALERFRDLLREGNEGAALTAVTDEDGYWRTHVLDSLSIVRALAGEVALPRALADVGSGAGIPAIPIAIAFPGVAVTAIESTAKKARFIEEAARALGLFGRVRVVVQRAEEAGRDPALRDRFDVATARALADLPVVAELCLPFVRPGGLLVAYKGRRAAEEVERAAGAFRELAATLEAIVPAGIEGTDLVLVKVRKTGPTPERYPRRTGVPGKRPLSKG
jgi:16S rRNA (guanine527-N7)-methyltransferase